MTKFLDHINFDGHFKIQAIDSNNKVIDEWEDDNLILESARITMAEKFANINTNTEICEFKLGTLGHVGDDVITVKDDTEGFVKERDRLFSEPYADAIPQGTLLPSIIKNDCIQITGINEGVAGNPDGYWIFTGETSTSYQLSDLVLTGGDWEYFGDSPPFTYTVGFQLPGISIDTENGDEAVIEYEDDSPMGSEVFVLHNDKSVQFTVNIVNYVANEQTDTASIFTEAALYFHGRIFSMKTFKAKIKDDSVLLRIIWTINF